MKVGTESLLKFKRLQRRLKLPMWAACGVLESIWNCAYRNAKDGAIGRLSNEDIAADIGWEGDADELVGALVDCGWLDVAPPELGFRLVVHDWSEHAANFIKGTFTSHGKTFADQVLRETVSRDPVPETPSKDPVSETLPDRGADHVPGTPCTNSIQFNSSTTNSSTPPKPPKGGGARAPHPHGMWTEQFWTAYPAACPRREAKAKCGEWIKGNIPSQQAFDVLLTRLAEDKARPDWLKEGGRFIPAPLVWLHKRRHEDPPGEVQPLNGNGNGNGRTTAQARDAEIMRPAPHADPTDAEALAAHRRYLEGIGYSGEALEAALAEFAACLEGDVEVEGPPARADPEEDGGQGSAEEAEELDDLPF